MFDKNVYTEGDVTYRFSLATKKWEFSHSLPNNQTATILVPGRGKERAHKVAKVINGALKRTKAKDGFGKLDNLGRANINQILAR